MRAGAETALVRVIAVLGARRQQLCWEPDTAMGPRTLELLVARSVRSGKRAASIMILIQSARINGHHPYTYHKDVLTRLPRLRVNEIELQISYKCMQAWLRCGDTVALRGKLPA